MVVAEQHFTMCSNRAIEVLQRSARSTKPEGAMFVLTAELVSAMTLIAERTPEGPERFFSDYQRHHPVSDTGHACRPTL